MTSTSTPSPEYVELLLFDVGTQVFGADATQVIRIDRPGPEARVFKELGSLRLGGRALVFSSPQGEAQLTIDAILGIERAAVSTLRRVPLAGAICPYALGFWLDEDVPVLLLDLNRTLDQGR